MADKTKKTFPLYVRKFLNRPKFESGGHIIASVERLEEHWERDGQQKSSLDFYYELSIADCSRVVTLSFRDDDPGQRANSLYKLQLLIDTITDFRDAVEESYREQDAWKEAHGD